MPSSEFCGSVCALPYKHVSTFLGALNYLAVEL